MDSPGGICKHHVLVFRARILHRVIDNSSGVRTLLVLDELHSQVIGVSLNLFKRAGPVRVPCREHNCIPLIFEAVCQFCNGCSLTCAIDACKHDGHRFRCFFDKFVEIKAVHVEHF